MRTFRLLHDKEEFYLLDGESEEERCRTITVLVTCDKVPGFEKTPHLAIPTDKGNRVAVARWIDDRVEALVETEPDRLEVYQAVLKTYLEDCLAGDSTTGVAYFYEKQGHDFGYVISQSHPHGLAIKIFSRKELATAEAGAHDTGGRPADTYQTNNLCELLTRAANEGYAGAILDERDPIYFCVDEKEVLHFLRLSQDSDEEIEETLLDARGEWSAPFERPDLDIVENQDACDRFMIRRLGKIPFYREYDSDGTAPLTFCAIEKANEPGHLMGFEIEESLSPTSTQSMAPIFFDQSSALEFMVGRDPDDFVTVEVDDLGALLRNADRDGLTVFLEPGNHRSASGIFWLNGADVILDSFSGFWKLDASNSFVKLS